MDWPGAQDIAERLKKSMPPEIVSDQENPQMDPQQIQAQMNQMNQVIEQLTDGLTKANQIIDQKKIEIESDERIAFAKMETELRKEMIKTAGIGAIDSLNAQIAEIKQRLQLLDIDQPFDQQEPQMQMGQMNEGPQMNQNCHYDYLS
jgi:dihydroxyacetone kinase-like predicted kinase